jgi:hypothetical protein
LLDRQPVDGEEIKYEQADENLEHEGLIRTVIKPQHASKGKQKGDGQYYEYDFATAEASTQQDMMQMVGARTKRRITPAVGASTTG